MPLIASLLSQCFTPLGDDDENQHRDSTMEEMARKSITKSSADSKVPDGVFGDSELHLVFQRVQEAVAAAQPVMCLWRGFGGHLPLLGDWSGVRGIKSASPRGERCFCKSLSLAWMRFRDYATGYLV